MPEISIIIPCYNVVDCLKECLESVLRQTFSDIEIICVEDCSTDSTKSLLKNYEKENKIKIIYHERNKGLAISRNDGMKIAKGKYIFFLDSDDTISPTCLEVLYREMEMNPECDICCGSVQAYPDDIKNEFCVRQSKQINDWVKFKPFKNIKISIENFSDFYLSFNCLAWNKLYKHNFLTKNNLTFIWENCCHEDNGFWLKVLSCFPTLTGLGQKTYLYRIKKNSISDQMDRNKKKHIKNLKRSLQDALVYVKSKKIPSLNTFVKSEIYNLEKHFFFCFIWQPNVKQLKLLSIPIFGYKKNLKKKKTILKILYLPILNRKDK